MGKTVPNQKTIIIHKKKYLKNFLQVGIDEIQEVVSKYNKSTVALYLYLCANADGYNLALSQVALENAYGVSRSRYYEAVKQLEDDGYLVKDKGNTYNFYTSPISAETEVNSAIVPNSGKSDVPKDATVPNSGKVCPENGTNQSQKWIQKQIIYNNKQIDANINTLSAPIGATSRVNITLQEPKEEGKEKALPITEAQLAQVVNYEDCGNGKYFINGRYFYLQN